MFLHCPTTPPAGRTASAVLPYGSPGKGAVLRSGEASEGRAGK
jgi:hypothetical protein